MTDQEPKSSGCPRWIKIALAVSLAVNLLIFGIVGGMAVRFGGPDGPPRMSENGGAYTHALTPKDRREIGKEIRQQFVEMRQGSTTLQEQYREMLEILKAEPFDRSAAEDVLGKQSGIVDQRRKVSERALLNRLEAMTPAERAAFVERLENGIERGALKRP